jgi:hypothetical protein
MRQKVHHHHHQQQQQQQEVHVQAHTLKMDLTGAAVLESHTTIMESAPASAVAIHRLSSLTAQQVIVLH